MEESQGKEQSEKLNPKKEKEDLKKRLEEYRELIQRLQADFENYKKRIEKEKAEQQKYASVHLVSRLLPVLDSFELALKNISPNNNEKFVKGMELVYAQLYSALQEEGLEGISAVGEKFDPYKHEVLMQEESEKDNIVLEEFQKGYMLKDKVLRHSKVKIGRKKENA